MQCRLLERPALARAAVVAALLLAVAACAEPDPHPQAGALFRERWWNFYQRALAAADAGIYDAARADLSAALDLRARDQRMARTYGMHFVDYFPHRELGIIHWLQGELETAEALLTSSLTEEPSAKARFYLDQVRKALIDRRGAGQAPPRLDLALPADPFWSVDPRVRLSGRADDPGYVSAVAIDGEPLYLEGARRRFDFDHELTLPQGCRTIIVEAKNLAGGTTRKKARICVDSLGPQVVVSHVEHRPDGLVLDGTALDCSGVADLRIDGRRLAAEGEADTPFSVRIENRREPIRIDCRDRLGNRSRFVLENSSLQSGRAHPQLVAGLHVAGLFDSRDTQPPAIRLADWQDRQTVYLETVVLSGSVHDPGSVVSLTINGRPLLPRKGPMVFFTHLLDLAPGLNPIVLEARDAAGNLQSHVLTIERRIPKALLLEERLRLAVFAFEQKGRVSEAAFAFQDDFIHALVQRRRFQVVERERLELILQEQKINRSALIDPSTALRLGNLAAAQAVVAGSLVETRTGIEIVGRVIDGETAEILCSADVYSEDKTLPGLKTLAQALTLKLHREFPLVDGLVLDRQGDTIITDLTLPRLRAQRRLLIYTETPVHHPQTGRTAGMKHDLLGAARVTQGDDNLTKARLRPDADPSIRPRHKVTTQ